MVTEQQKGTQVDKKEQFITAIHACQGFIYRIATVYTHTTDDRNDLVQEIIYQLWKSFDTFKQQSAMNTWIYRVALNVALYQLNASKKRVPTVPVDEQVLDHHGNDDSGYEEKWKLFRTQA